MTRAEYVDYWRSLSRRGKRRELILIAKEGLTALLIAALVSITFKLMPLAAEGIWGAVDAVRGWL